MSLIRRPLVLAVVVTILWLLVRQMGGVDDPAKIKADETIMTSGFITSLTVFIALLSAAVFQKTWTEWTEVRNAVKGPEKDEKAFMRYVDERIPPTVKAAMIVLYVGLLGSFFILSNASLVAGIYMIFAITFALAFYWEVIEDLDEYWNGEWNISLDDVPDEWEWSRKNKPLLTKRAQKKDFIKILLHYFSGWGLTALFGSATLGTLLAMAAVGLVTKSPDLTQPAGIVGALLGVLCAVTYVLHIDRKSEVRKNQ